MKKFSSITNQKVGQEPAQERKINERDELRLRIMQMIDNYLHIQTHGPVDRYQRAGTIKITGKESLAEALLGAFGEKSLKDQTRLLESLKSEVRDWEMIDGKIEEAKSEMARWKEAETLWPHEAKLAALYEKYGHDEETLLLMADQACAKIGSAKTAEMRSLAAAKMAAEGKYPKQAFETLSEKFGERHKHLSSEK